ncbi:choice-of-anchor Q domain-containing protein [Niabella sp. CJ426]|uniref:choice-of-anchor Q domain-containing protein n=1 Tax=Niabella sp. CJ426 TaxID=3393740 RepID=UPI003CFD019D
MKKKPLLDQSICFFIKAALLLFLTGSVFSTRAQNTRYIKPSASGLADGSSWANAANNLQAVIDAAANNDTIWIAAGTYQPGNNQWFNLTKPLNIYGGFSGNESALQERSPNTAPTILRGNGSSVLRWTGAGIKVIDKLSVTGGRGTGAGGLLCSDGVINISNCRFFDNRTSGNGGGVLLTNGSAFIQNSIFYNNAAFAGFAIWAQANVISVTNCTIADNAYIYHPYTNANGSTIFSNTNSFSIQNSIFWNNTHAISSLNTPLHITFSNIQGGFSGTGNINSTPLFTAEYKLQPASPCINAGDPQTNQTGYAVQSGELDLATMNRIAGTRIDMGAFENESVLPVRFGHIAATIQNQQLVVKWSTLTETNNDYFDIEVSADGKHFKKLTTIQSLALSGNSDLPLHYEYIIEATQVMFLPVLIYLFLLCFLIDAKNRKPFLIILIAGTATLWGCSKSSSRPELVSTKIFLRIAQIDRDGKKEYSKTITVVNQ